MRNDPSRPATLLDVERLEQGLLDDLEAAEIRRRLAAFGDPRRGLPDDGLVFAEDPPDRFLASVRGPRGGWVPWLFVGAVLASAVALVIYARGLGGASVPGETLHPQPAVFPSVLRDDTGELRPLVGPPELPDLPMVVDEPEVPARPEPPRTEVRPKPVPAPAQPSGAMVYDPMPDPAPVLVTVGQQGLLELRHDPRPESLDVAVTLRDAGFQPQWSHRVPLPPGAELRSTAVHEGRYVGLYLDARAQAWWLLVGTLDGARAEVRSVPRPAHVSAVRHTLLSGSDLYVAGTGRGRLAQSGGAERPVLLHHRLGADGWNEPAPLPRPGSALRSMNRVPGGLRVVLRGSNEAGTTHEVVTLRAGRVVSVTREDATTLGADPRDVFVGEEGLLVGSYADEREQSGVDGLFVRRADGTVVRHAFTELPRFLEHLSEGARRRLERRIERRREADKSETLNLEVDLVRLEQQGALTLVAGQLVEPMWVLGSPLGHAPTDANALPSSPPTTTPDGEIVVETRTGIPNRVFTVGARTQHLKGWHYVHGFVVALGPEGEVVWAQILPFRDVELKVRRPLFDVAVRGERAVLFYHRGDGVVRMLVAGPRVLGMPQLVLHALPTPDDRLVSMRAPHLVRWTSDRYLLTVVQRVSQQGRQRSALRVAAFDPWH